MPHSIISSIEKLVKIVTYYNDSKINATGRAEL